MKTSLVLLTVACLPLVTPRAARGGENPLVNGRFDAEQVAFPEFWTPSSSTKGVVYQRTGGPEGRMPAIVLKGDTQASGQVSVQQQGPTLLAGETYKLSAYIKTKGFKSRNGGLIIHNAGWTSDTGLKKFPGDSDWTSLEKIFTLFPSRDKEYGVALAEAKARGLKWLADFNVAPMDDPATLRARMEKHAGLTQPQYDGFTSDELFFGRTTIDNCTKALWGCAT